MSRILCARRTGQAIATCIGVAPSAAAASDSVVDYNGVGLGGNAPQPYPSGSGAIILLTVQVVYDLDKAIALADDSEYGLPSSIFNNDLNAALQASRS